jgi:hypothetical protein
VRRSSGELIKPWREGEEYSGHFHSLWWDVQSHPLQRGVVSSLQLPKFATTNEIGYSDGLLDESETEPIKIMCTCTARVLCAKTLWRQMKSRIRSRAYWSLFSKQVERLSNHRSPYPQYKVKYNYFFVRIRPAAWPSNSVKVRQSMDYTDMPWKH